MALPANICSRQLHSYIQIPCYLIMINDLVYCLYFSILFVGHDHGWLHMICRSWINIESLMKPVLRKVLRSLQTYPLV